MLHLARIFTILALASFPISTHALLSLDIPESFVFLQSESKENNPVIVVSKLIQTNHSDEKVISYNHCTNEFLYEMEVSFDKPNQFHSILNSNCAVEIGPHSSITSYIRYKFDPYINDKEIYIYFHLANNYTDINRINLYYNHAKYDYGYNNNSLFFNIKR